MRIIQIIELQLLSPQLSNPDPPKPPQQNRRRIRINDPELSFLPPQPVAVKSLIYEPPK